MNTTLYLIRKAFVAILELKEQYDTKQSGDKIMGYAKAYLNIFEQLQTALPREVIEASTIDKAAYWIYRKPSDSYNDVRNTAFTYIFRLEDAYIKLVLKDHHEELQKLF